MRELYSDADLEALFISFKLATITTALLVVLCTPLAFWLSQSRSRLCTIVEAVVSLPLVLPPTVLGFYLLRFLGPDGWGGRLAATAGAPPLTFTFGGLLFGSMVYSLPFVVQPLQAAFRSVGPRMLEAAATLRASPLDAFFSVVLPLSRRGYLSAAVLAFAHTLGEFGVLLMIGGNIPGRTQVASIAIYNHVEAMDYRAAHVLSATLLALCFSLLALVYGASRRVRASFIPS